MRRELQSILDLSRALPREDLIGFLSELETIRLDCMVRLTIPASQTQHDSLLDVEQAAARLHCSEDFLYRNHKRLPFTRRIGNKLLFSSNGIDRYLQRAAK
jgi:hypothetical protein